VDYAHA